MWFWDLINWLFGYHDPTGPTEVRHDMTTRTISFKLDEATVRQRPIAYTELSLRVDETYEWTPYSTIIPDPDAAWVTDLEFVLPDVNPGTIHYQLITYDDAGTPSDPPVEISKTLDWDAPTGPYSVTIVDEE